MRGITLHTIPEAMGKAQWWAFAHGTHDSLLNSQVASNRPYFKDEGWSKMHFLFYWLDGCILNLLARSSSRECRKIICLELVYFFAFFFSDTCLPIVACQRLDLLVLSIHISSMVYSNFFSNVESITIEWNTGSCHCMQNATCLYTDCECAFSYPGWDTAKWSVNHG